MTVSATPSRSAGVADNEAGGAGTAADLVSRGIAEPFTDTFGELRAAPAATLAKFAARFGGSAVPTPPIVVAPGQRHPELAGRLTTEQGAVIYVAGQMPDGLVGYHRLVNSHGVDRFVLCAPATLPQPEQTFGWAVQLYAARSERSWGIGDFADLALIADETKAAGGGAVLVSPIHAMAPTFPQQNSPYSPSSRRWLNVLHIAIRNVPGADLVDLGDLETAGIGLNKRRRIDRDAAWQLKRAALRRIWVATRDQLGPQAQAWIASGGQHLTDFATYTAISEVRRNAAWSTWPVELSRPRTDAVNAFAAEHADLVAFHAWCQWVADIQFEDACGRGVDIVADLAVGFDAGGADAWCEQDSLCFDFEVGCPPDGHNREGQKWGLPPLDPDALIRADFAPFITLVRAGLRHARGLRIDHVAQLWRLYWVPVGVAATEGAYVRYPTAALLAILRIEADRAGAWVVGEDMGTVPDGVRDDMADTGMLGYRACLRSDPANNPECSMGASSTHDQATISGTLTGSDANDMAAIGKAFDAGHLDDVRRDLARRARLDPDAAVTPAMIETAILAQYATLSNCPSRVVLATLDDAGAVAERPNMPGTIDQWPNWRLALPVDVVTLLRAPLARRLAAGLRRGRARPKTLAA